LFQLSALFPAPARIERLLIRIPAVLLDPKARWLISQHLVSSENEYKHSSLHVVTRVRRMKRRSFMKRAATVALPGWPFDAALNGDGKLELLSPGHRGVPGSCEIDFHCYDAATGRLKWRLPIPGSPFGPHNQWDADSPTTPAVADIDGEGCDEAVFAIGKALYAVGGKKGGDWGAVRWTLEFPGPLGPPAIADTRGDGRAEIVVVCADGHVYGVGAAAIPQPA
jgi:hypothetical protein